MNVVFSNRSGSTCRYKREGMVGMYKHARYVGMLLILLVVADSPVVSAAEIDTKKGGLVIVNAEVKEAKLTKGDVANIFLGKKSTYSDKSKIVIVTLKEGAAHTGFLKTYLGKTPAQFKNYWKKLVFTGKAKQPKSFKTEKELVEYVGKTKGAIGYISLAASKDAKVMQDKVKTIPVTVKKK